MYLYGTPNHIRIWGEESDGSECIQNSNYFLWLRARSDFVQQSGRQFLQRLG